MKRYRATLIQNGRVLGSQEFEAPDGPTAWREANAPLDPFGGRWADVREITEPADCGNCHACLKGKTDGNGMPITSTRMIGCAVCGNKRCPKASDHRLACTGSNEPGQAGSRY